MPKIKDKPKEVSYAAPKKKDMGDAGYEQSGALPLSTLTGWYTFSDEAARKKHWEWFVIDQFLRGNHNVRGNPNDNTVVVTQRSDTINYPINKIFSTFRAVRAFVTRHKPTIEVEPTESTEGARTYARRAQKLLDRDNQLNNFRRINKEWVYYGVKYGIGWRQIGYDPKKKVAIRWTVDPFDLLIGSKTGKAEDAPYLIKTFVRTVGYMKHRFPKAESLIIPDNEIAADEYKRLSLQILYPATYSSALTGDEETMIGKECWYRIFKQNKNGGFINKCTFTDTGILDFEETPYTEYPFIAYESETTPNELFPEGHMKHVISPQRMLNLLETQLLEYNHIVNRGRFIKDKNAGFKVIYAKEGQIIEKNPGKQVTSLSPPPINPALIQQIGHANDYIEDIGGQHDASMGTTPARVTSGAAIEALQLGDSNNISDLRDNFEDALAKEAAWILKMYSLFEKDGVVMDEEVEDQNNPSQMSPQKFAIIGQEALGRMGKTLPVNPETEQEAYYMEDNGGYCDVCNILPDNNVKVSVTSELGETKEARMNLLFKLVEAGLPLKFLLENIEFPNTEDVFTRIADEALADMQMEQLKAQQTQQAQVPQGMPPQGAPPQAPQEMPQGPLQEELPPPPLNE